MNETETEDTYKIFSTKYKHYISNRHTSTYPNDPCPALASIANDKNLDFFC
jgi:hypothetical protein